MAVRVGLTKIDSSEFTWVKNSKVFIAEASDFTGRDLDQLIYDDAVDVGFVMISQRTGKEEIFALSSTIYMGEGEDREVAGWKYLPANLELLNAGICVHILND